MKTKHLLMGLVGAVLLGVGALGIAQRTMAAEESAQKKLETSMGKMYLTEWTRVTSASQLKNCTTATPMRLYGVLGNKTYLIYDSTKTNASTLKVSALSDVEPAIAANENFAELTPQKPTNVGYIQYTGKTDDDNDDAPMCYISLNSDNDMYLGVNDDRNLVINASWKTAWTVLTKSSDNKDYVSLFVNIAWHDDPALWFRTSKDQGELYSDTSGKNSSYTNYIMYLGETTDITVIQSDVTVGAGQTVRISAAGGLALQDGCTLKIEKGGAALVESCFLNQGTIDNRGTLVIMDNGSLQPVYSTGGILECNGGDLLIMKNGRFMSGEDLTLSKGSTILNRGIFLCTQNLTLNNGLLITEEGGNTFLGYNITADDFRDATVTSTYNANIAGTVKLPSLTKASLGNINDTNLTIRSGGRLLNRGTTVIYQKITGVSQISSEKGTAYYNK